HRWISCVVTNEVGCRRSRRLGIGGGGGGVYFETLGGGRCLDHHLHW
ncbi:hypothetical protein ACHAXM_008753, partial [Skeletonema potamos]